MGIFSSPHRGFYVPPIGPDGLPLMDNSTTLGRLGREAAEVLYDSHGPKSRTPAGPENITPATSWGDRKCEGIYCSKGGNRGSTGMYEIRNRPVCRSCAVLEFGFENLPGGEQSDALAPYLLKPK